MALPRRASGGVFGSTAVFSHRPRCLQAPIDWGQSIYTAQRDSVTGYHGRAIVPNGSTATRQRRSLQFYGCFLQATKLSAHASIRSIGDNRSTLPNVPAARAPMVEPLSPMALPRRASGGVFGSTAVSPTGLGAFKLRSIGDNRSTLKRSFFTYQNRDTNRTCCYIQSADEKPPSAVFDFSRMHTDMMVSLVFR
jgi:hypothetical protein